MPHPIRQSDTDACPGALRLHAAADGPLARVRLPGGMLTGPQLAELGAIAAEWGDGGLELTSRANVQLRALTRANPASLAARLHAAGLLPSETHETVRNIAAPPLASAELRALVTALDDALCADPALANLPGRFLFALGQVPLAADLTALPVPGAPPTPGPPPTAGAQPTPGVAPAAGVAPTAGGAPTAGAFAILFAGRDEGLRVPADRVVEALLAGAHAFLAERAIAMPPPWRLAELPGGPGRMADLVSAALGLPRQTDEAEISGMRDEDGEARSAIGVPPQADGRGAAGAIGVLSQADGCVAVGTIVPLGRLTGEQIRVLAGADRLVLTPSRGVVVPDLLPEAADEWLAALAGAGLPVGADSRWSGVTACAGRPGCAKSLADVRADALAATRYGEGLPVHWVGCARGCGSPSGPHVRVEATPVGYAVRGRVVDGDLAEVVSAARRA
ncbi:precorrin-3B synthase [Paractinoplanes globisporus]|uniref:Precorrin-3B synthase n=1 Tax=Paractinoplanes globisporus TaxID=113565 RepID=A0ABW6WPE1_9ACTN|nr:precorrin-3B synthase [Actinoplanes globisporus]